SGGPRRREAHLREECRPASQDPFSSAPQAIISGKAHRCRRRIPATAEVCSKGVPMKSFKASLFAAAAALTMLASGAADAQTEVKIGYALAENSHYGVAAKAWAESVEQATNGMLKFRQFP